MKIGLFFTLGISAMLWKERGLLDREKLLYERMLKDNMVKKVVWFTYGTDDNKIKADIHNEIEIISMPGIFNSRIGKLLYSFLIPFIHKREIEDLDILKTNQMSGCWSAVISSRMYKKPLIVRTGYTWSIFASKGNASALDRFATLSERMAYRYADLSVVATMNDREYVIERYGVDKNKIRVIPNYIDTDLFYVMNRDRYEDRIVFVGRLTRQKNLEGLIRAIKDLPYSLDVYGTGEMEDELKKLAGDLDVNVRFLGNVPNREMPEILNRYNLFALPSLYEGMPKTLLEAMACGCAVIGTNVDGIREIIRDDVNGILCDTGSDSIRNAVAKIMQDKSLRERLGKKARSYVEENCSLVNVVKEEIAVYKDICKN